MNKKTLVFIVLAFAIFCACFFLGGPALQTYVFEPNQPYLMVDPERKSETGCEYDYLTYIPCEKTGRTVDCVKFYVTKVPTEYAQFVHYPESWDAWWNWNNPKNQFSQIIYWTLIALVVILGIAIVIYLAVLWRKGVLKKIKDKWNQ